MGALFRVWIRRAVLVVGDSSGPASGRAAGGVDDSVDVCVCDRVDFAGGEAADQPAARASSMVCLGHGLARHQRICVEQSRNANGTSSHRERPRFALWRGDRGAGFDFLERTCCEMAVGRDCYHFLGDFFDQFVERASAFQISPPVKLHADI